MKWEYLDESCSQIFFVISIKKMQMETAEDCVGSLQLSF